MSLNQTTRILSLSSLAERAPHLESFLLRSQIDVTEIATGREMIEILSRDDELHLAAVSLPVPDMSVGRLVTEVRGLDKPIPLIFLGRKAQLEAARVFQSPTVRVVHLAEGEESLRRIIAEALGIATRLSIRIPIHLEVGVDTGSEFHYCETRNLSSSGMLVSSSRPLPVGSSFSFELMLPHSLDPLPGVAEIVRHSDPRREDTTGFAARFLNLATSDTSRIERLIRTESLAR